jgi:F0F1-type ATP synthase assembly protein I
MSENRQNNQENADERPKYRSFFEGVDQLSLGISMVVAVIFGVGVGLGLKHLFGYGWLLWLGVFWGVAAAGLNVYKAYQKQVQSYDAIKDDPKYKYKDLYDKDDEDDERYDR